MLRHDQEEPRGAASHGRFRRLLQDSFACHSLGDTATRRRARRALLDEVFEGSKLLKMLKPMDKTSNACLMAIAQKAIREASIVYILGYGFDEQNPERLQLSDGLSPDHRQAIMFTNFCDSNRVNKKAARGAGVGR